jgi:lysophospholipase L1-like esterase
LNDFIGRKAWRETIAMKQQILITRYWRRITALGATFVAVALVKAAQADSSLPLHQLSSQFRPTLFIIGDSTVNNPTKGLQGWGTPIADYFDQTKIKVENRARGGRSSRTYQTEGIWNQVLADMKSGDFVLMQFGHNDGGSLTNGRARASLKGNGDETQEVADDKTGKKELVHSYGWYLRKYITDTKAKGATAIVLSPIPRNIWKDDHTITRASGDYGQWAKEAAAAESVAFIDLNGIVAAHYEALGPVKVKAMYFLEDHTHTTPAGAQLNAASVVEGIRGLGNCTLGAFLLDKPVSNKMAAASAPATGSK